MATALGEDGGVDLSGPNNDAYMRDLRLAVPSDCVASNTEEENRYAPDQMRMVLKADTRPSAELSFQTLARGDG